MEKFKIVGRWAQLRLLQEKGMNYFQTHIFELITKLA